MGAETALEERILRWLPPRSSDELRKIVDLSRHAADPAAVLRYALAHKARSGIDRRVAARVEQAAIDHLVGSSYAALPQLVPALHLHFPEGLCEPRVRAAIHIALELEVLGASELVLVLQPLLAGAARFGAYVSDSVRGPLGARLRLAALCRGVASATRRVGGLTALLSDEHAEVIERSVERLWCDRDSLVGVSASWAAGTLLASSRRLADMVEAARRDPSNALLERRALVALSASWIHGDLADDEVLELVFRTTGRQDPNLRATVISALRFGVRHSPDTVFDLVWSVVAQAPPEVLLAAVRVAYLYEEPRAEALMDRIRARATRFRSSHGGLAQLLWPKGPEAKHLLAGHAELRSLVGQHPSAAASSSMALLQAALDAMRASGARSRQPEEIEAAIDLLLLDSTLVYDAAIAGARSRAEQQLVCELWHQCTTNLFNFRLGALGTPAPRGVALREALRRLARATDARSFGPLAARDASGNRERHLQILVRLNDLSSRTNERVVDLSLAAALSAAIEPLLSGDALPALHLVALLLGVPSAGMLKHLATLLRASPPSGAVRSLSELRMLLDRATSATKHKGSAAAEVAHALARLGDECNSLGVDSALCRGLRTLRSVFESTHQAMGGRSALDLPILVEGALGDLRIAQQQARSLLGAEVVDATKLADVARAVRSLLPASGFAHHAPEERLYKLPRALRELNAATPAILRGIWEVLVDNLERARRESLPPEPRREPWVGRKLGDYVVTGVMGAGGMGYCLAVHRRLEHKQPGASRFVLKVPRQTEDLRPFREEAIALLSLAALNHPAIVRFMHFVDLPGKRPFIVMEYVEGETLEARLKAGPSSVAAAIATTHWLSDAVAHSHTLGISHYDIKPSNVILRPGGVPVLVDWGLAGTTEILAGTLGYMAPERYSLQGGTVPEGRAAATASPADVFALGCILAEMLTGKGLFRPPIMPNEEGAQELGGFLVGPSAASTMAAYALVNRPRLHAGRVRGLATRVPPGVFRLLCRMVAIDPRERPTARQAADELSRFSALSHGL